MVIVVCLYYGVRLAVYFPDGDLKDLIPIIVRIKEETSNSSHYGSPLWGIRSFRGTFDEQAVAIEVGGNRDSYSLRDEIGGELRDDLINIHPICI